MGRYFVQRLLLMIPTMFGVSIIVFMMVRFLPGSVIDVVLGEFGNVDPEVKEELLKQYNLDSGILIQYKDWLADLFRGDLGVSLLSGRSIVADLKSRIPVTVELSVMAVAMSLVISIPIGVIAAIRQDSPLDYLARSTAVGMLAIPNFWLATMVLTVPNMFITWAPPSPFVRFPDDPLRNLYIMAIPAAILSLALAGGQMRLIRTQLLEVLRQDYIRTAWAKGLRERTVIVRHALKNALIPVISLIGIQIPILIGGAVIIEFIFGIPGVGSRLVKSIIDRDYSVIQAINLFMATLVVFVNLLVDMTYAYLDPRVRYR
ncbi:MAG: ABC transporter permease [Dehalococcoidia bacterium]